MILFSATDFLATDFIAAAVEHIPDRYHRKLVLRDEIC